MALSYRSIFLAAALLISNVVHARVPFSGALGVDFDMGESDLRSLGFQELWSPEKLKHIGVYSRLNASDYFNKVTVKTSPITGEIFWVEGGKSFSENLETCSAHLRTVEETRSR